MLVIPRSQERVKKILFLCTATTLMREYLSLKFERELQRLTEEQGLEREGRTHKQHKRQLLGAELERERLARSGDQRNIQCLQRDFRERQQLLEELQQVLKAPKKDYG